MSVDKVMLLIDADNVSIDVVEQAIVWVNKHYGGPHVRRAYCTAESAVKHQGAFKRLSIRPMVNLAAGKNSTDIALAVDAIDLVITERPEVVAIASSDSDFAPLVSRLREKGCRVVGLGQEGKVGDETIGVYDDYEVLAHRRARAAEPAPAGERAGRGRAAGKKTARGTRAAKAADRPASKRAARGALEDLAPPAVVHTIEPAVEAPAPAPAPVPESVAAVAPKPAAKKTSRRKPKAASAATPEASPPLPEKAQAILAALPALARGETVELRVAAEKLRDAGLLSKSGSSTKLFGQFPELFELQPPKQPNHVKGLAAALRG
jgi:uncharacterized protein (TIGR00288 family)